HRQRTGRARQGQAARQRAGREALRGGADHELVGPLPPHQLLLREDQGSFPGTPRAGRLCHLRQQAPRRQGTQEGRRSALSTVVKRLLNLAAAPHFSGVSLTLRKWISAPSDCKAMRPLVCSALVASLTFWPLITIVTASPLQVISYLFHSPSAFSTSLSVFVRNQWRPSLFSSSWSLGPSSLKP